MNTPAETDYLVVGAGASGLAFVDALVTEADVEVTVIDRRPAPGGHWVDAYPFVRLHTPSAYYGVNSLALGGDRIDPDGENAGFYERATGAEVREHFAGAVERLEGTGRVRVLTAQSTWATAACATFARASTTTWRCGGSWSTRATSRRPCRRRTRRASRSPPAPT